MLIANLIIVFLLSLADLWLGIPMGFALNLNPFIIGGISMLGAIWSIFLVLVIGEKAVSMIMRFRGKKAMNKNGKTYKFWEKYGVPGFGLVAPFILGAPLGTAVGIALGCETGKLVIWMSLGIAIKSIIVTTILWLGVLGAKTLI